MSIFNKDALSSFFGLSGEEDDYYDNYEEYEERKAVNEPPRRAARPKPQRPVQQQESYSQPAYTQQSEPVVEKPSARYRSAETHQERDTQQAAYTEKKWFLCVVLINQRLRTQDEHKKAPPMQKHIKLLLLNHVCIQKQ